MSTDEDLATGCHPHGKTIGEVYAQGGSKIVGTVAILAALKRGDSVEAPNAGASTYRPFLQWLGFTDIEDVDRSSSAGDWSFKAMHGMDIYRVFQHNRHPGFGFAYNIEPIFRRPYVLKTEEPPVDKSKPYVAFAREIMEKLEDINGVLTARLDDWTSDGILLSAFVELEWEGSPDMFGKRDQFGRQYSKGDAPGKRRSQLPRISREIRKMFVSMSKASAEFTAEARLTCPEQVYETVDRGVRRFSHYSASHIRLDIRVYR